MGGRFEIVKFDCNEGVDYNSGALVGATRPLDYTEDLPIARLTISRFYCTWFTEVAPRTFGVLKFYYYIDTRRYRTYMEDIIVAFLSFGKGYHSNDSPLPFIVTLRPYHLMSFCSEAPLPESRVATDNPLWSLF